MHPHLAGLGPLELLAIEPEAVAAEAELVFCALPHGAAAAIAPSLLEAGCTVIDLSGDYRLAAEEYPDLVRLRASVAGLAGARPSTGCPSCSAIGCSGAKLVANPGCFATPAILGCAPLLDAGLVEADAIRGRRQDRASRAPAAGATEATSFAATEARSARTACRSTSTRRRSSAALELASGAVPRVLFAPHLVPTVRGVLTTCYLRLRSGASTDDLTEALHAAYGGRAFVRVLPPGGMVDAKRTAGTNLIELQAVADPRSGTAVVIGAIDNLDQGRRRAGDPEREPRPRAG